MLVIDVSINRKHKISTVGATRVSPKGKVEDDTVCTYEIGRVFDGKIKRVIGTVEHTYGDGAEVLAAKMMLKVSECDISAIHEQNFERLTSILETQGIQTGDRKIGIPSEL